MKTVTWQLRDGSTKESIPLYHTTQILIVDDINDSGDTFSQLLDSLQETNDLVGHKMKQNVKTASLWERSTSKFKVDFNENSIDTGDWIIFPWELPPKEKK